MLVVLYVPQEMGRRGYVCPSSSRATGRTSVAVTPTQSFERNSMNTELSALSSRYIRGREGYPLHTAVTFRGSDVSRKWQQLSVDKD